ncbi:MAG: sigma-70 family RNA polymerase sigma factor [Verrucomicrobiae bacterium]|nr:sigma-70 family RNA polymerase sigma factor [Verrucomicrobiae bacterium]
MGSFSTRDSNAPNPGTFPSTHWSAVLSAGSGDTPAAHNALGRICEKYWYPLYVYVRRRGYRHSEAQDLTQDFFAFLLQKESLRVAAPEKGRFRSFLLTSLSHFLSNEWDRQNAAKRGGGRVIPLSQLEDADARFQLEPAQSCSADRAFEKIWAMTLLENSLRRMEEDWKKHDKSRLFEALKPFLMAGAEPPSYEELASRLGMNVGAVKMAIFRLRRSFRDVLCQEIAQTVDDPTTVEEEIRHFIRILSSPENTPQTP